MLDDTYNHRGQASSIVIIATFFLVASALVGATALLRNNFDIRQRAQTYCTSENQCVSGSNSCCSGLVSTTDTSCGTIPVRCKAAPANPPSNVQKRYGCVNGTCMEQSGGEFLNISECSSSCYPLVPSPLRNRQIGESCTNNSDCVSNNCVSNKCAAPPLSCPSGCLKGCYSTDGNNDGKLDCIAYCKADCVNGCISENTQGGICKSFNQPPLPIGSNCDPNTTVPELKCAAGSYCHVSSTGAKCVADIAQAQCPSSCPNGCVTGTTTCKPYCNTTKCPSGCSSNSTLGGSCKPLTSCFGLSNSQCVGQSGCEWIGFCKPKPSPSPLTSVHLDTNYIAEGGFCGIGSIGVCTPGTNCIVNTCQLSNITCTLPDQSMIRAGQTYIDQNLICNFCSDSGSLIQDPQACNTQSATVTCFAINYVSHSCTPQDTPNVGYGSGCPIELYPTRDSCVDALSAATNNQVSCTSGQRVCYGPTTSAFCTAQLSISGNLDQSGVVYQSCPFRCNPSTGACFEQFGNLPCTNTATWCENGIQKSCIKDADGNRTISDSSCANGCDLALGTCAQDPQLTNPEQQVAQDHGILISNNSSGDQNDVNFILSAINDVYTQLPSQISGQVNSVLINSTNQLNGLTTQNGEIIVNCDNDLRFLNSPNAYDSCKRVVFHEIAHNTENLPVNTAYCDSGSQSCSAIDAFTNAAADDQNHPIIFNSDGSVNQNQSYTELFQLSSPPTVHEYYAEYQALYDTNPDLLKSTHPDIYQMFYDMYHQ